MGKKDKLIQVVFFAFFILVNVGVIIWALFFSDSWYFKLEAIFHILLLPLFALFVQRIFLGGFCLEYKPSLIPKLFKEQSQRSSSDISKYYYLGRYYFDKTDYNKAEKFFNKSIEADFYKDAVLELKESRTFDSFSEITTHYGIDKQIDDYYEKHNGFIAFVKSSWLFLRKSSSFMLSFFDGVALQNKHFFYFIKTRKINSSTYDFLYDFDEDKMQFIENTKPLFDEGEKFTEEQKNVKQVEDFHSAFDGSVDLRCIRAKLMLDYGRYDYYEKSLEISHKLISIVEKSTNQTILWRLLYVRGCAYHKLGEADLACKDWKRGIELGDTKYCQEMYEENCKI